MSWDGASTASSLLLERRTAKRSACHPGVTGQLALAKQGRLCISSIGNVSAAGVSLLVPGKVAPGMIAALSFQDMGRGFYYSVLTRVVAAVEDGAGRWLLHCAFARPLPPEVLRALIEEP